MVKSRRPRGRTPLARYALVASALDTLGERKGQVGDSFRQDSERFHLLDSIPSWTAGLDVRTASASRTKAAFSSSVEACGLVSSPSAMRSRVLARCSSKSCWARRIAPVNSKPGSWRHYLNKATRVINSSRSYGCQARMQVHQETSS